MHSSDNIQTHITNSTREQSSGTNVEEVTERIGQTLWRADLRNIGLLLLGFVFVLLVVPPAHNYPISDDWAYARAVGRLLDLNYTTPESGQVIGLSHFAWGAIFSVLFGQSFDTLTASTLVMSAIALVAFYLLLRQLKVRPAAALFRAATLGCNPLVIFLSYSFMTDVTFLAFMLLAGLFFLKGLEKNSLRWPVLGSIFSGFAYLDRQYGILIVVALLLFLWRTHVWSWRSVCAIVIPCMISVVGYGLWEHTQPPTSMQFLVTTNLTLLADSPFAFVMGRVQKMVLISWPMGLFLLPCLRLPRRILYALPVFAVYLIFQLESLRVNGSVLPAQGDVLDRTGYVMWYYNASPIWNEVVWTILGIVSALCLSMYIQWLLERAVAWGRFSRKTATQADGAQMLYILAGLIVIVVFAVSPGLNDRYLLPVVPLIMVPSLRYRALEITTPRRAASIRQTAQIVAIATILGFAIIGQRDYMDHATARWRTAEDAVAGGVPINEVDAGFEWVEWNLSDWKDDNLRAERATLGITDAGYGALDPVYRVSDVLLPGYVGVSSTAYRSWLDGGQERYVLLLKRK